MRIILISGKARMGKDSLAAFMKEDLEKQNKKVLITHYADLLKFICINYFNWNGKKDVEGRQLLQYIGTDKIRAVDPDIWVMFIIKILKIFPDNWDYVLIPDCRFVNEVSLMKKNFDDVNVIRIHRPNFINDLSEEQRNSESETALDNYTFDYVICNDSTLDNLKLKAEYLVEDIL